VSLYFADVSDSMQPTFVNRRRNWLV